MDLTVILNDTKRAKLTVTGDNKVRIKVNRSWDESLKRTAIDLLSKVAEHVISLDVGVTLRGRYTPGHWHVIQMKSTNKTSPEVFNIHIASVLNG